MKTILLIVSHLILLSGCSNKSILINDEKVHATLLISESFDKHLNNWTVEQREDGTVELLNGQMDINDASGCTVWYNQMIKGNIMIEYDVVVVDKGGDFDRVSDLNCFWMANEVGNTDFFANSEKRGGKFQNYHAMQLYYVGLGGHNNTKTRFRRYAGGGDRPCLPEHDLSDPKYLIKANELNKIRLIVYNGRVQYYRNNQMIYDFKDNAPYTKGYFGLRTYKNHMTVDNFRVYQLK